MKNCFAVFILVLCFSFSSLLAQSTITVQGTIRDENSMPVPGANIIEKNTSNGTISNIDGEYSISLSSDATLEFSSIGFSKQSIAVQGKTTIDVVLKENMEELEEVVVVGYGSVRKSDLTGAISSVKSEDLIATSITSLDQGLQGRAAGVVVSQTSGQPGGGTSIRIRGTSSIYGTNEPLYVIDGVPVISDATALSSGATASPNLNPLASINPNDIASIEVLKDASATAIYGARGANGVILITTKRGKKGSSAIAVSSSFSVQELSRKIPMLNARELAELGNEAADNAGVPRKPIYASPINLGEGTDWQDEIFKLAPMQDVQISAIGGNESTQYALSANYLNQEGIIISSSFKKAGVRGNIDAQLNEKLKVGFNINIAHIESNGVVTDHEMAIPSSITSWALEFNPGLPVYDENGDYTYENNTSNPAVGNPVADALETQIKNVSNRIIGNLFFNWELIKDLDFKMSFGGDAFFNEDRSFTPNYIRRGESSNGEAIVGNTNGGTWLWENTLNYKLDINNVHRLNILGGYTMQKFSSNYLYAATADFDDNRLNYHAIQNGKNRTLSLTHYDEWQMVSFIARVNYNLYDKYLFTFTERIDGSSKFGKGNKYGFFPSGSFAWRMIEEDFLKNRTSISNLKTRVSYGLVGNEGIPSYSSLAYLKTTQAYLGENEIITGVIPSSIENKELKWETTAQFNVGLDFGIFKERLTLTADYYRKKTTDILLDTPLPYLTGYTSAFLNIGSLRNEGFEVSIGSVNITGGDFFWKTDFNLSHNKNKILELSEDVSEEGIIGNPILGITGWTRVVEGQPIGNIYGYETNGIIQLGEDLSKIPYFSDSEPTYGDRKYVDQDNNGILDEDDIVVLGNAVPLFNFGMNNTFTYKNISLVVYLQGVIGNEIVNFNKFSLESFDGNKNNSTAALQRWTPDNPTNEYPRANATPRANTLSDAYVEDGSYLRVKNITLKYDFPKKMLERLRLSSMSVYVTGINLFTFTNYEGYDPEVSRFANNNLSMGADYGSYPMARIYTMGFNLSF